MAILKHAHKFFNTYFIEKGSLYLIYKCEWARDGQTNGAKGKQRHMLSEAKSAKATQFTTGPPETLAFGGLIWMQNV